jgi:hypothetical protein
MAQYIAACGTDRDATAESEPMANTLIHESRRLQFPLDTLVDALIELEEKQGHWPSKATVVGATIDQSNGTDADGVVLSIHRPESGELIERRYSLPMIAAAIVNYCVTLRVPMPRKSTKSIEVLADGIALVLENTVILQSRHEELSTLPAGSVQPPASIPATPEAPAASRDNPADAAATPPNNPADALAALPDNPPVASVSS